MELSKTDDTWDVQFRQETDRNRRREILKTAEEAHLIPAEEAELRRSFLDARYDRIREQEIDYFIRGLMRLDSLCGKETKDRVRRAEKKIMEQVLEDWQYSAIRANDTPFRKIWYDELYNMTRLYIELCETDKRYNSVLLGFGRMKEETRTGKIAAELREMMYVIPERLGRTQELSVFVQAAGDAFADRYPGQKDLCCGREISQTGQKGSVSYVGTDNQK